MYNGYDVTPNKNGNSNNSADLFLLNLSPNPTGELYINIEFS